MKKVLTTVAIAAFALSAAACDATLGLDANAKATMSFAAVGNPTLFGGQSAPNPVTNVSGHTTVLTSAEMRFSRIVVKGDSSESEMKGGTTIVALPVDGKLTTPVAATLAAGSYDKLEMKLESVRMKGTYDGKPFDITVHTVAELETAISPPLVVKQNGSTNLTAVVNIESWFRSRAGDAIDLLSLTSAGQAELQNNIRASFRAFDDDNRNGHHDSGDDD